MLSTFPAPKKSNLFFFPNSFGIPDDIFTAIVRQSNIQIVQASQSEVALTDEANIETDASLGVNFYVTLTDNRTMSAPTNLSDWQVLRYYITQDGTGNRTLAWNAVFRFSTVIPSPTLTTTANFSDYIEFINNPLYETLDCIRVVKGFDSTPH